MQDIQEHVSLTQYSTMRLGGTARYLTELHDKSELAELYEWANQRSLPVIMIGVGSNIIWRDEGFDGLVIVNKIQGFEVEDDEDDAIVSIGAGENWDSVVERCCALGLNGIAELSLIPGTAGATPLQNVGAYGREIADVLVSLEAFDTQTHQHVEIGVDDCGFGYRTSRFKTSDRGRFLITGITLQLSKSQPQPPYYQSVQDYLAEHEIAEPTVQDVRSVVVAIRTAKLPDPAIVANNGSFFANPVISAESFAKLADGPDIRHWDTEDGRIKLSAAWLIESAGFKDYHDAETGMATWPNQPLVFVNESAKDTKSLIAFRQKIVDAVQQKFGVELQQEPELLPAK